MPIRNRHKVGDWLVADDESGFVHYASETVQLWDGSRVHKDNYETRNPQEFVRPNYKNEAAPFVREPGTDTITSAFSTFVGETSVRSPTNFRHIFEP
jgi:hypothetical protein